MALSVSYFLKGNSVSYHLHQAVGTLTETPVLICKTPCLSPPITLRFSTVLCTISLSEEELVRTIVKQSMETE